MKPLRRQGLRMAAAAAAGLLLAEPARAASPLPQLLAADMSAIAQRGVLVVSMSANDSPPFFHKKADKLVGIDVRMAEQLANEMQVKLRIDRTAQSFNEVIESVVRGEADLGISKLSHTLPRAMTVHFSDPYLVLSHALLLNRVEFAKQLRDRSVVQAIRNFNGALAVIANSAFADFALRHFPQARIVALPTWDAAVEAVRRGQVTGAYRDEFEVRRVLQADPSLSLTLRTVLLKGLNDSLAIAVGVRNTTLLAFVNKFVDQRVEKLTVDTVLKELR
jgi:polar amino acid transport system substrate-binding protein